MSKVSNKHYGFILLMLMWATVGLSAECAAFFGKNNGRLAVDIFVGGMIAGAIGISIFHFGWGRKL